MDWRRISASAFFGSILAACHFGEPQTPAVVAEPPAASHSQSPEPSAGAVDHSAWSALVAQELVWARPDLQLQCSTEESPFFLPEVTRADHAHAKVARAESCRQIDAATAHSVDRNGEKSLAGLAVCCPRSVPTAGLAHAGGGKSCEQAIFEHDTGSGSKNKATAGQYDAVLNRGTYMKHCGVPDTTAISICAAVQDGKVVGVTVRVSPLDPRAADCVAASVRSLEFPTSTAMDVTRTVFR